MTDAGKGWTTSTANASVYLCPSRHCFATTNQDVPRSTIRIDCYQNRHMTDYEIPHFHPLKEEAKKKFVSNTNMLHLYAYL
jgi:hypothetical protein